MRQLPRRHEPVPTRLRLAFAARRPRRRRRMEYVPSPDQADRGRSSRRPTGLRGQQGKERRKEEEEKRKKKKKKKKTGRHPLPAQ